MAVKKYVPGKIRLDGVRLSFCQSLWKARAFSDRDDRERHKANFLVPKNSDLTCVYQGKRYPIMVGLKRAKMDAITKKVGAEESRDVARKIKPGNYAVRDGDLESWDGYEDCYYVSASTSPSRPPIVIGRSRQHVIAEEDGIIYAGCYVNAIVTLYYQAPGKNPSGEVVPSAVWATLGAVQFVKDGDKFSMAGVNVEEDFEDLEDEEELEDIVDEDEEEEDYDVL